MGLGLESRLGSHLGVDDVGQTIALLDHLLRVQVSLALGVVLVRLCRNSAQHAVSAARQQRARRGCWRGAVAGAARWRARRGGRCGAAAGAARRRARGGEGGAAMWVSAHAQGVACGGGLRTRHHSYETKVPPGLRQRMISR